MLHLRKSFLILSALCFSGLAANTALAGVGFSIVGAGDFLLPTTSVTTSGKINFGGGALLDFSLGPKVGIELGGLYMLRKFSQTVSGTETTLTLPAVEIPLVFRLWPANFLSVGIGGYTSIGIGNVTASTSSATVTNTYANTGLKTLDYGLLGSLGFRFKLGAAVGIVMDSRFLFGLAEQSTSSTSLKYKEIQGLLGIRFGM